MTIDIELTNLTSIYYNIDNRKSNKIHRMIKAIIHLIINKSEQMDLILLGLKNLYNNLISNDLNFSLDNRLESDISNINLTTSEIYHILIKIYNNT
jgi:hypothetical protein